MLKKKPQDISFESGIAHFYKNKNAAEPGDMPKKEPTYHVTLRYHRRTVGISRFYTAMQQGQKIDEVIRCPAVPGIEANNLAELPANSAWYIVRQVQYPEGTAIPVMDISLERTVGA